MENLNPRFRAEIILNTLRSREVSKEYENEDGSLQLIEDNLIKDEERREKLKKELVTLLTEKQ